MWCLTTSPSRKVARRRATLRTPPGRPRQGRDTDTSGSPEKGRAAARWLSGTDLRSATPHTSRLIGTSSARLPLAPCPSLPPVSYSSSEPCSRLPVAASGQWPGTKDFEELRADHCALDAAASAAWWKETGDSAGNAPCPAPLLCLPTMPNVCAAALASPCLPWSTASPQSAPASFLAQNGQHAQRHSLAMLRTLRHRSVFVRVRYARFGVTSPWRSSAAARVVVL